MKMNTTTTFVLLSWFALANNGLAQPAQILRTFNNPANTPNGNFGAAVAVLNGNALIGAPNDTINIGTLVVRTGKAYLLNSATGNLIRPFRVIGSHGDSVGYALAAAGTNVLVGAPFYDIFGVDPGDLELPNTGVAYLFNGNTGNFLNDDLKPITRQTNANFGSAVAAVGNFLIVGAPRTDVGSVQDAGAVYVLNDSTGAELRQIPNPEPGATDFFGSSIAVVGSNIVVGAHSDGNTQLTDFGSVYLINPATGALIRTFRTDPLIGGHGFGSSVAAFGSNVLIGAANGGAAYLFNAASGAVIWKFRNPSAGNRFGASIASVGNFVIVGAPNDDEAGAGAGAVYIFDGITGNLVQKFTNPTTLAAGDNFGAAVAGLNATSFLVGAPLDEVGSLVNAGSAHSIRVPQLFCTTTILSPRKGEEFCNTTVTVKALVSVTNGTPPITRTATVNDVPATFNGDTLTATIPLSLGFNTITVSTTIRDAIVPPNLNTCTDAISVTRIPNLTQNLAINEILYDPNYADFGAERVELRNIGGSTVRLDSVVLWIRRDTLNTYWAFPSGRQLLPDRHLVIHWLAKGTDDAGNIFTGPPIDSGLRGDASDRFWGNNSFFPENMTLGGAENVNTAPFTIALMQQIVRGTTAGFNDACRMVDFAQIGGRVPESETVAAQAGLWSAGDFIPFAARGESREGHSLEFTGNSSGTALTSSKNFHAQKSPSLGLPNVGATFVATPSHLLITEICVRPGYAEFIEIYNPDSSLSVALRDYYLTDNSTARNNAYINIVQGPAAVSLNAGDFFVSFPPSAIIGAREYQTIAIKATDYYLRYRAKPTYELVASDPTVRDMVSIKPMTGLPNLADAGEAVTLLRWSSADGDLVTDVDYVAWGKASPPARQVEEPPGPSPEAINKTGVGIDGGTFDNVRSYYDAETDFALQRSIANNAHALLKSWQRPPRPRELGELIAGGNGVIGHDETSERLNEIFREYPPTPKLGSPTDSTGAPDDEIDLDFVRAIVKDTLSSGNGDGILNPGEDIRLFVVLRNNTDSTTGHLYSVLRFPSPYDQFVTLGADSTANYPPIAPDGIARSVDSYEFSVNRVALPDTIRFVLFVVDKRTGKTIQSLPQQLYKNGNSEIADSAVSTDLVPGAMAADGAPVLTFKSIAFSVSGSDLIFFVKLQNSGTLGVTPQTGLKAKVVIAARNPLHPDLDSMSAFIDIPETICVPNRMGCTNPESSERRFALAITPTSPLNAYLPVQDSLRIILRYRGGPDNNAVFNRHIKTILGLPFVAVSVKYPRSNVLVPGIRVDLIKKTDNSINPVSDTLIASTMTTNEGRAIFFKNQFGLSMPNKSYHLKIFARPFAIPSSNYNYTNDWLAIDELDGEEVDCSCSERAKRVANGLQTLLSPFSVFTPPQRRAREQILLTEALLGNVDEDGGNAIAATSFTGHECPAITAFINWNKTSPRPEAARFTGRWKVAKINMPLGAAATAPVATVADSITITLGSSNTPGFSATNQFVTINSMLLGDLDPSWKPPSGPDLIVTDPICSVDFISVPNSPLLAVQENSNDALPKTLQLYPSYPNPFMATAHAPTGATVRFALPRPEVVTIKVYDILGQLVHNLTEKQWPAGTHNVIWRGDRENGAPVVSGMYFVRLQAGNAVKVQRVMLLR